MQEAPGNAMEMSSLPSPQNSGNAVDSGVQERVVTEHSPPGYRSVFDEHDIPDDSPAEQPSARVRI